MLLKKQQVNEESRETSMAGAEDQAFENKAVKGKRIGARMEK
jgi:hypothetical protein